MLSKVRIVRTLVVVATATAIANYAHGPSVPLDLTVYLRGGESVLDGADQVYSTPYGLLPFTYPPFAAALFSLFTLLPSGIMTLALTAASYAGLYVLVALLWRRSPRLARIPVEIPFVLAALMEPVASTIDLGQIDLVLAAMVLFDLTYSRERFKGYLLAIAICVKVTPAVFLILLVLKRDWATLKRVVLACSALTILPVLVIPHSWVDFWFNAIWNAERVGGVAFVGNQSLNGLVWRAAGPGGSKWLVALLSAAALAAVVFSARRLIDSDMHGAVIIVSIGGLLVSPISWSHHWVWIVPFTIWLLHLCITPSSKDGAAQRWLRVGAIVLGASWTLCTLSHFLWIAPAGNDIEYTSPLLVKLVADSYVILGAASIAFTLRRGKLLRVNKDAPDALMDAKELRIAASVFHESR